MERNSKRSGDYVILIESNNQTNMNDSHWERKMREKFSFLYPSEQNSKKICNGVVIGLAIVVIPIVLYAVGTTVWNFAFNQSDTNSDSPSIIPSTGIITDESIEQLKDYLHASGTDLMLSKEQNLPTYENYLKDLEKTCPYYKPDGVSYRECLYNLLEERDKRADTISNNLVKDIQIVISEKKTNPDKLDFDTAYFGEQHFLESFAELQKSWKSYRDALCDADYAASFAGSNTGGFIMTCKLYETEKYVVRLIGYRYNWVGSWVQYYLDGNIQPRTSEFKALTERERRFLD